MLVDILQCINSTVLPGNMQSRGSIMWGDWPQGWESLEGLSRECSSWIFGNTSNNKMWIHRKLLLLQLSWIHNLSTDCSCTIAVGNRFLRGRMECSHCSGSSAGMDGAELKLYVEWKLNLLGRLGMGVISVPVLVCSWQHGHYCWLCLWLFTRWRYKW